MDGVRCDVDMAVFECHRDDKEVVDMVEVLSNQIFGDRWMHVVNDQNSRSTSVYLKSNIRRKIELTVRPRRIYLDFFVSKRRV